MNKPGLNRIKDDTLGVIDGLWRLAEDAVATVKDCALYAQGKVEYARERLDHVPVQQIDAKVQGALGSIKSSFSNSRIHAALKTSNSVIDHYMKGGK